MTKSCDPLAGWGSIGHIWTHIRGMEDAAVDVELIDVSATQARVKICCSFRDPEEYVLDNGEKTGFWESTSDTPYWTVECQGVNKSQGLAKIEICYSEAEDPTSCSDHETLTDCEAAGCYWYNGACYSSPYEPTCSNYITQTACEAAGCHWCDGVCQGYPCGEDPPEGSTKMELDRATSILGFDFTLRAVDCARGEAVVEFVGTGLRKVLVLGAASVLFPLPFGAVYLAAVWVNNECTEIATRALKSPKDPEEKGETIGTGQSIDDMDVIKHDKLEVMLDPEDLADITMEELKRRDIDIHKITQGDKPPKPDWATQAAWDALNKKHEELLEEVAAGRITIAEFWALWDEASIEAVTYSYVAEEFTLEVPTFVMSGDVTIRGRTPKKSQTIQIMAVKKYFGFDWLASDQVLKEATSDEFFQYETDVILDEFGIIEVYSRIPKEWWAILDKDIETPRHTVFVLTWTMLIFLIIAAALIYDKSSGGKLKKMLKGKKR